MNQCFALSSHQPKININFLEILRNVRRISFQEERGKFTKLQNFGKSVSPKPFSNQIKNNHMQFLIQQSKIFLRAENKIFQIRELHSSYHMWSSDKGELQQNEKVKNYVFLSVIISFVIFCLYMEFAMERHQDYVRISKSNENK